MDLNRLNTNAKRRSLEGGSSFGTYAQPGGVLSDPQDAMGPNGARERNWLGARLELA